MNSTLGSVVPLAMFNDILGVEDDDHQAEDDDYNTKHAGL